MNCKVNWAEVPNLNQMSDQDLQSLHRRNKLHVFSTNRWFRSRYQDRVKPKYLFYPEERRLQMELKHIFRVFDTNKSETLDLAEIFIMFKHFGFEVSQNDLKIIYSYIDQDRDMALNYDEFKAFTENPGALKSFRNMMAKLQKHFADKKATQPNYVPLSVGAMLTYLFYMLQRERHLAKLEASKITVQERFSALRELIIVKEKKTILDEAFELYLKVSAEAAKQKLKHQPTLHLIDDKQDAQQQFQQSLPSNLAIRKSISCATELQPILFRNMSMRDAETITHLALSLKMQTVLKIQTDSMLQNDSESEEEKLSKEDELKKVLLEAQKKGESQAMSEIALNSSQLVSPVNLHYASSLRFPKLRLRILPNQRKFTNDSTLRREYKVSKYANGSVDSTATRKYHDVSKVLSEKSPVHQSTIASQEPSIGSKDEMLVGTWTNRILSQRLPIVK